MFSCVDAHLPRALLNRLSYEKGLLLFDMGSAFRVSPGAPTAGAGRVVVTGPWLALSGLLDTLIRIGFASKSLPPEERARQVAEGYVSGADVPQPSVVAFNTLIAGAAVVEFLRAVTEFAARTIRPNVWLDFDG